MLPNLEKPLWPEVLLGLKYGCAIGQFKEALGLGDF